MPRSYAKVSPPEKPQHYCCVLAMSRGSAMRGENTAVLWPRLLCQPGKKKSVCSSYGSWSFPLAFDSCLANPGFREQCGQFEQQDSVGVRNRIWHWLFLPKKVMSFTAHIHFPCFFHLWLSIATFSLLLQMTSPLPLSCN